MIRLDGKTVSWGRFDYNCISITDRDRINRESPEISEEHIVAFNRQQVTLRRNTSSILLQTNFGPTDSGHWHHTNVWYMKVSFRNYPPNEQLIQDRSCDTKTSEEEPPPMQVAHPLNWTVQMPIQYLCQCLDRRIHEYRIWSEAPLIMQHLAQQKSSKVLPSHQHSDDDEWSPLSPLCIPQRQCWLRSHDLQPRINGAHFRCNYLKASLENTS
jgi:hypothetical protein